MQTAKKLAHRPEKKAVKRHLKLVTNRRKQDVSLGFIVMVFVALLAAVAFSAVQQTSVTQTAIEVENLQEILQEERACNQKLVIELAQLKSPERIQKIALGRLGMVVPSKVNYVKISDDNIKNKLAMRNNHYEKFSD